MSCLRPREARTLQPTADKLEGVSRFGLNSWITLRKGVVGVKVESLGLARGFCPLGITSINGEDEVVCGILSQWYVLYYVSGVYYITSVVCTILRQ